MRRFLLVFFSVLVISVNAQASAKIKPIETSSGNSVWLVEDHTLPVVTFKIAFPKSGGAYDPAGKSGLSVFLSQMLDEGAGDMNALAFRQALEDKAIRFSADTGMDMTTVTVQTLSEHKEDAMDLMMTALTKPRFDAEAVERIRASILSDLSHLEEEPMYVASRRWKELAFPGHTYGMPRRGTIESVKSITAEDMRVFARNHYFAGAKPIISVVGDITEDEVKEWELPELAVQAKQSSGLADLTMPEGEETPEVIKMNVPQSVFIASLQGVKRNDLRYPAMQVLNQILGGDSITSRLGSELRNKRGLVYHIGTDIEIMDHAAYLSVGFATRNAEAMEALKLVRSILSETQKNGITEEELKNAKNYLIGSFPLGSDTQNELAGMLIGIQYYDLGIDYMDKRASLIEKVSREEVNLLAKELLSRVPLVVIAGSPGSADADKNEPNTP